MRHDALGLTVPGPGRELPILCRDACGQLIQYPFQHDREPRRQYILGFLRSDPAVFVILFASYGYL